MSKGKEEVRHLHRDNDTAFCNIPIATVLATFEPSEATCDGCKRALDAYVGDLKERLSRMEQDIARFESESRQLERDEADLRQKAAANDQRMQELHTEMAACSDAHHEALGKRSEIIQSSHALQAEHGTTINKMGLAQAELDKYSQ